MTLIGHGHDPPGRIFRAVVVALHWLQRSQTPSRNLHEAKRAFSSQRPSCGEVRMFEYDDAEMLALQFMIGEFKSIAHDPEAQRRILRYLNDRFALGLLLLRVRPRPEAQPPLPFPQD